jgi:hypothetical protein
MAQVNTLPEAYLQVSSAVEEVSQRVVALPYGLLDQVGLVAVQLRLKTLLPLVGGRLNAIQQRPVVCVLEQVADTYMQMMMVCEKEAYVNCQLAGSRHGVEPEAWTSQHGLGNMATLDQQVAFQRRLQGA